MKKKVDIPFLVASLLLLVLFFVPLWRITLEAPQYPEGISMYIWINKITGDSEFTLQNINILNHYVGMKYIEPDSIPELKYFPIIIAIMVALGVLAAFSSSKLLKRSWVITLILLAVLGIYDFYLWEYDYGHNLSETAPIKVPGMAYQPPLFGSKMLLNFRAESYPHWGGGVIFLSMAIGVISQWIFKRKTQVKGMVSATTLLLMTILLSACSNKPQALNYEEDSCHSCKMLLIDQRFGSEWISDKGKVYKFDAVECLLDHLSNDLTQTGSIWVTPFNVPKTLVPVESSYFLVSKELPSPMGMYLTAYDSYIAAQDHQNEYGGDVYNWAQLQEVSPQLKNGLQ
ncbi:MAG: hypothetical protein DHS20C17_33010 [Cyclobacteriaceae bacterium]|nr:MAG: hypothetical protein DHS20C17_33010 [Cyclobacteriaceae bacterium]